MLTAKNLERIMELEDKLRTEYQAQLDAKSAELDAKSAEIDGLVKKLEEKQAVVAKQLEQITTMSSSATENKRVEQLNRELNHRSERLEEEVGTQKKRIKTLQKDLAQEREEIKTLKRFDAVTLKKNLDANKKKLAEKSTANDLLQKSLNKTKSENVELQSKVKELEAKLPEPESTDEPESAAA